MRLEKGQRWQFFNGTTGETRTYELESFEERAHIKGARATLRNIDTDGLAQVTCHWLTDKTPGPTGSVWSFLEEARAA